MIETERLFSRECARITTKQFQLLTDVNLVFCLNLILYNSDRCAIMIPNDDREGSYAVVQICDRAQRQGQG